METNNMPAKRPAGLTLRDLQVFTEHEVNEKTLDETAEALNVSRDTVKRTKKRGAYRDLVLSALEEKGFTVNEYVKKLIELTEAEKVINCGGHNMPVDDNTTRMKAIEKIGKVFGDDATPGLDVKHSLQSLSDEELRENLGDMLHGDD
jgi:hypothetical protein